MDKKILALREELAVHVKENTDRIAQITMMKGEDYKLKFDLDVATSGKAFFVKRGVTVTFRYSTSAFGRATSPRRSVSQPDWGDHPGARGRNQPSQRRDYSTYEKRRSSSSASVIRRRPCWRSLIFSYSLFYQINYIFVLKMSVRKGIEALQFAFEQRSVKSLVSDLSSKESDSWEVKDHKLMYSSSFRRFFGKEKASSHASEK